MQSLKIRYDKGIRGDCDVFIRNSEVPCLRATVLGDAGEGVVEAKCFELFHCE